MPRHHNVSEVFVHAARGREIGVIDGCALGFMDGDRVAVIKALVACGIEMNDAALVAVQTDAKFVGWPKRPSRCSISFMVASKVSTGTVASGGGFSDGENRYFLHCVPEVMASASAMASPRSTVRKPWTAWTHTWSSPARVQQMPRKLRSGSGLFSHSH